MDSPVDPTKPDLTFPEKLSEAQAQTLSEELSRLTRLQYEAVVMSPYNGMSTEDADAYDERRWRIAGVCEMLRPLKNR
jgi:hypothetical protein